MCLRRQILDESSFVYRSWNRTHYRITKSIELLYLLIDPSPTHSWGCLSVSVSPIPFSSENHTISHITSHHISHHITSHHISHHITYHITSQPISHQHHITYHITCITYHSTSTSLQWCHNERDGVSNHQPHDFLMTSSPQLCLRSPLLQTQTMNNVWPDRRVTTSII